jgi:type I restriction enzyme S subunit
MNLGLLLEHFDRLSDAPDAIPRLRRFVLDLAVRGMLVEQDRKDEPVSELLKRIQVARSRVAKKQKDTPNIDGTKTSLVIPPNWELVPLIALGTWAIGSGFPKNEQGRQDDPYFFLKVSDMNLPGNEKYIVSAQNSIDRLAAQRMRARIHPPNTIIFPKIGGAIATNKRRILTRGSAIDNNCLGITFWPELSINWCYLLLISMDFAQYQAGSAVPALQQGVLEQIPVGVPPLAEQHRIVSKVDELLALCDRLEAARGERDSRRDRLIAASHHHLNNGANAGAFREHAYFYVKHLPRLTTSLVHIQQLRQTILNLAVRGQLVQQDSNDESASELLRRIQMTEELRGAEAKSKMKPALPPVDSARSPFELPSGWTWARFPELGRFGRGKSKHRPRNDQSLFEGGIHLLVQTGDVARSKGLIKTFTNKYNDVGLSQSFKWPTGTLCITIAANIADSGILTFDACFPDSVVGFIPSAVFPNARYFEYFVRTAKADLLEFAPATAQKNINLEILNAVLIPLPPLPEQHRIVAKVDELMAVCDQLEGQITAAQTRSSHLLEYVLYHALDGTRLTQTHEAALIGRKSAATTLAR